MTENLRIDDKVLILDGGPHEHIGRIATISHVLENDDVVIYFGDQDEDDFVYSPNELLLLTVHPD